MKSAWKYAKIVGEQYSCLFRYYYGLLSDAFSVTKLRNRGSQTVGRAPPAPRGLS
jgi:hypothetical protein